MTVRYNRFTKFYTEDETIVVYVLGSKDILKIGHHGRIYDFLVFLEKNIIISYKDITEFKIPHALVKLFLQYNILITYEHNSGVESIYFDQFIANPDPLLRLLDEESIHNLYVDVETGISSLLNMQNLSLYNMRRHNIDIAIDNNVFINVGSTRLKKTTPCYDVDALLNLIAYIFSPREEKHIFGSTKTFFKFGSGGGINSTFPIIITKNDDIFIFEKYSESFYKRHIPGIFLRFIKDGLITSDTNFSAYNYFVLLGSHPTNVYAKYGNKGYKLLLLEIGQISFMMRLLCGYFNKPQLEIQGYYDDNIYDILYKSSIFTNKNFMLHHVLAISD